MAPSFFRELLETFRGTLGFHRSLAEISCFQCMAGHGLWAVYLAALYGSPAVWVTVLILLLPIWKRPCGLDESRGLLGNRGGIVRRRGGRGDKSWNKE